VFLVGLCFEVPTHYMVSLGFFNCLTSQFLLCWVISLELGVLIYQVVDVSLWLVVSLGLGVLIYQLVNVSIWLVVSLELGVLIYQLVDVFIWLVVFL